jgi:hypothetical protein
MAYAASLLFFCRLHFIGFEALTLLDSGVLLAFSAIPVLLARRPDAALAWQRLALILPSITLITLPWQADSGLSLLAIASLYLLVRRQGKVHWSLYLALIILNIGFYQLLPNVSFWQVSIVPLSISLLWLIHAHTDDLSKQQRHHYRIFALSTLFASLAVDMFLQPSFVLFAIAMGGSLIGLMLAIAFRIRALLYTSNLFLVLNVLGQLLQYYPEQTLGKALLLIGFGFVLGGGMLIFSLKREQIRQRWHLMRADLGDWQ